MPLLSTSFIFNTYNKVRNRYLLIIGFVLNCFNSFSQTAITSTKGIQINKTYLEIPFDVGFGFNQLPIFSASNNETLYLSPGGGVNVGLRLLYRMPSIEYSAGITYSFSSLSRTVKNASASFHRFIIDPQVKLILKLKNGNAINPAAGVGFFLGGKMDIDGSKLTAGEHDIFKYNTAVGGFLSLEYEWLKAEKVTFGLGLRYYTVRYDLKSLQVNSQYYSVTSVIYKFKVLNGDGLDFLFRLRIKV